MNKGTWSSRAIERYLLGAIVLAVQRGNLLAMLTGYSRAIARAGSRRGRRASGRVSVQGGGGVEYVGGTVRS